MRLSWRDVEAGARFDVFFEEERQRLFKALYFVTGNRHDAEELTQDAFLKLWERWGEIDRINDPTDGLPLPCRAERLPVAAAPSIHGRPEADPDLGAPRRLL